MQPTYINVVPRILEKIASQVVIGMQRSSLVKRKAFAWAMGAATRYRRARWDGTRPGLPLAAANWLARLLVFQPLLRKVGLSKIRAVFCAGAPLPLKIQELWEVWGINVRNLYGITEDLTFSASATPFPHRSPAACRSIRARLRSVPTVSCWCADPVSFAAIGGTRKDAGCRA